MREPVIIIDYYEVLEKAEAELKHRQIEYQKTHIHELSSGMHFDDPGPMGTPGTGITASHIAFLYELAQAYDNRKNKRSS